jgi:hypothetical protein
MFRLIRSVLLVLVLAILLAPAAFAGTGTFRPAAVPGGGVPAVWKWVVSLFMPLVPGFRNPGAGIVTKEGSSMDPNGSLQSGIQLSNSTTNAGSQMDLNGSK